MANLDGLLELDPFINNDDLPFNIVIYQNYGFGDMVQYLRYISKFRESFTGKLCLLIKGNFYEPWNDAMAEPPSFKCLILKNYGQYLDDVIIDGWNAIPSEYTYKTEFMNLKMHIGFDVPINFWKKYNSIKLNQDNINVGYCLEGSRGHPNDKYRSIEKIYFTKFINTFKNKVNFINLSQESLQSQFNIINIEDTISVIQSLDLVITVDTLVTHLAGYNNIPIFLLHGKINDNRWKDKNWYNNLNHFYLEENNEWNKLINTNLTKSFEDWWESTIDKKTRNKNQESKKRY